MEFSFWFIGIGALLIAMNLGSRLIARAPLSPAMLYFAFGVALGPWGFGWLTLDPLDDAVALERIFEFALLVSLFATGSNLGGTLRGRHWSVPLRLATGAMLVTIAALCALAYFVLGLSLGASIVLAAALSPTDPVLAGDVQVADPADRDRLRFGLTGEAGLNDGAALPFVMLGLGLLSLHELGPGGWRWWAIDLVWAVAGGLAIGAILGVVLGRWLIRRNRESARSRVGRVPRSRPRCGRLRGRGRTAGLRLPGRFRRRGRIAANGLARRCSNSTRTWRVSPSLRS